MLSCFPELAAQDRPCIPVPMRGTVYSTLTIVYSNTINETVNNLIINLTVCKPILSFGSFC